MQGAEVSKLSYKGEKSCLLPYRAVVESNTNATYIAEGGKENRNNLFETQTIL